MGFGTLLDAEIEDLKQTQEELRDKLVQIETKKDKKKATPKLKTKKKLEVGCDHCPANQKGIAKIFGKVKGKKLFIFAQNPGPEENEEERELVGKSGKWLWDEFSKVGISRKDCDIQNVVRCFTQDGKDEDTGRWLMRAPNKEELHCCSKYNDRALAKSKAKVYVIFGQVAARQIFGNEYRKDRRMFWSERLKAKVYCLDHPSYFVRGAPQSRLDEFRSALVSVAEDVKGKKSISRYAYIKAQDYKGVFTYEQAKKEAKKIKKIGKRGIRTTVDIEDDKGTKYSHKFYQMEPGVRKIICVGFSFTKGRSRTFFMMDKRVRKVVIDLLEDKNVPKVMQHGSYDWRTSYKLDKIKIRNYHFDTQYSEFMAFPGRYSYALAEIANARFQVFSGYKTVVLPEAFPHDKPLPKNLENAPLIKQYEYYSKRGGLRLSQIPPKKMVLYNGADCDLTKRAEVTVTKKISLPLLSIYVDCAFVLDEMEPNGPWFDFEHIKKLKQLYPPKAERDFRYLVQASGKKDFNPNSPPQVGKILYKKLKLKYPFDLDKDEKPDTRKQTLEVLAQHHKFPKVILRYRRLAKIVSTYLNGYEECAKINGGRLRTKWWLTGTRTGRMSSGGTKDESDATVVNLQNIHGDPLLQDLIVADRKWRKLYDAVRKRVKTKLPKELHKLRKLAGKLAVSEDKKEKDYLNDKLFKLQSRIKEKLQAVSFDAVTDKYGNIKIILGYDFGQVEVRVAAQVSDDRQLIKDCISGDIHSEVGHAMTGWSKEKIKNDKKTRTITKNLHFGILFGLAAKGAYVFLKAKDPDADVTEEQVITYVNNYFKRYKGMARFIEEVREFVAEHGYIENIFGFRRPLNSADVVSDDEASMYSGDQGGAYWKNQAINTPIQGAAHHLMLMAMSRLKPGTKTAKKYLKMLGIPPLEVHDAIYFFVRLKNLLKAKLLGFELLEKEPLRVIRKMFPKIKWKVPLAVEASVGFRLGDTVDCAKESNIKDLLIEMFLSTFIREASLTAELRSL